MLAAVRNRWPIYELIPKGLRLNYSKNFAARLLVMVETKLLTNKHTQPWSDSIINETTAPPPWILDLSLASSKSNVESVVGDFAYSPPFEPLTLDDNFHIACLFLRYKRRELSWATFLY